MSQKIDMKDRLNVSSFDSYIKEYYNKPTQNRVKPEVKPMEKDTTIIRDSFNTTNHNYYYSDQDKPYRMSFILSTVIMIFGIVLMLYIAQMDISGLFLKGIFSIKFFEPLRQLYYMTN